MTNKSLTKGIVVHDGYANEGEPVVVGVGIGCYGATSRKLASTGKVVQLETSLAEIAEETRRAFWKYSLSEVAEKSTSLS